MNGVHRVARKTSERSRVALVRRQLYSLANRLDKQMTLGIVPRTMALAAGVRYLRQRLDTLANANLMAHYYLLVRHEDMINQMLPPDGTRFHKFREQLLMLIAEAKNATKNQIHDNK